MNLIIKKLGQEPYAPVPYEAVWQAMKEFTLKRDEDTADELWLLQHPPVYTQGQAGKAEHILNPKDIPIVQSDRGGQVTYHGPGQLVGYVLIDLKRKNIGIRSLVCALEKSIIKMLANYGINASIIDGAPGVYVDGKKICSIGLRVKKGFTYHGIALNHDMDLSPFKGINPCGFNRLEMTQISEFDDSISFEQVAEDFSKHFIDELNYSITEHELTQ